MRHFILGFSRFKTFLFSFSFLSFFCFLFFLFYRRTVAGATEKVGRDIAGRQRFLKTLTHYNLFVVIRCIQPVYILSDIFDKQQQRWKLFLRAVPLRRDETSKEMRRSVGGVTVYF